MAVLDDTDRKLLTLLQDDDRLSLAELGKIVGVPASTANDRIRRLQRQGLIAGFHARVSPEALGLNLLAFILVAWSDPKVEQVFLKKIADEPAVLECHHITGAWNYLLKVRVGTTRDLEKFLADTVKNISGIQRTETQIVLSSPKETWRVNIPD